MQALSLNAHRFRKLQEGDKASTIRHGRRVIEKGPLRLSCSEEADKACIVIVEKVVYKKWCELDDADAIANGCDNAGQLRRDLLEFYPQAKNDDDVTIIVFEKKPS